MAHSEEMRTPPRFVLAVMACLVALAACGGDDATVEPQRSYELTLQVDDSTDDYKFVATEAFDILVGDEVTFILDNNGTMIHDLEVMTEQSRVLGRTEHVNPGAQDSVTVLFAEPGVYRLNCNVDDHLTRHGMRALIEVTEPGESPTETDPD